MVEIMDPWDLPFYLETQRQGQVFEELFFVFIDNKNKCQENYEHKDELK